MARRRRHRRSRVPTFSCGCHGLNEFSGRTAAVSVLGLAALGGAGFFLWKKMQARQQIAAGARASLPGPLTPGASRALTEAEAAEGGV